MDSLKLSKHTTVWPELTKIMSQRYEVLFAANLSYYDSNMQQLQNRLSVFQSFVFSSKQRLVFSLYDLDFYMYQCSIGLTVHNLMSILIQLDIDLSHCVLFTNHHGLGSSLSQWCRYQGYDRPISVIENNYSCLLTSSDASAVQRTAGDILYRFAFLSNCLRHHRWATRYYLEDHQLVHTTLIAWNGLEKNNENLALSSNKAKTHGKPNILIVTKPFCRSQDKLPADPYIDGLYQKFNTTVNNTEKNPLIDIEANVDNFSADFLKYAMVNLVAETVFDYPYPYITEKTFKCFWTKSPFVIIGASSSLQYLHRLGFQTFDSWWNEDYDSIQHPIDRLKSCFAIVDRISKWSLAECKQVYNDMNNVLEHNYQHYKNYFCNQLLKETIEQL